MDNREILDSIEKLVEDYVKCWERGESKISVKSSKKVYLSTALTPCEQRYLIIVHYPLHELPLDVLRKLPVILIRTHKAQNVNHDHKYLWAWVAQVINETRKELTLFENPELLNQINLLFRINVLPTTRLTAAFPELVELVANEFIISACLVFPLLERLLKIKCAKHVKIDGTVIKPFEVPMDGDVICYGRKRKRVSRVGHLLYLFEHCYASEDLRRDLESFRSTCVDVYGVNGKGYGYYFIDRWRNILLHGEEFWPVMNAVLVNLITLLILYEIPDDVYLSKREIIVRNLRFWLEAGTGSPFIFYPPKD